MPDTHVRQLQLFPSARSSAEWAAVEPSVRNVSFFSACVEDERVLAELQGLVAVGLQAGWSMSEFVHEAELAFERLRILPRGEEQTDEERKTFLHSLDTVNEFNRLRLIFRTQSELAHGYAQFCEEFDAFSLYTFPGWRFMRMDGARESQKRPDHVEHEYETRLKTDLDFWLDRNRPEIGGFGNPYGPWGYNSWCYTEPVSRQECIDLGLMDKDEKISPPPELAEWNLPGVLEQIGTAGTKLLDHQARQNIIDACREEGFSVEYDPEEHSISVVPRKGEPLFELQRTMFDEWLDEQEELFKWEVDEEEFERMLDEMAI